MHFPKWCLFFDFHTMPACPDVGANFDVDAFTDRVLACGVDYLVFPARCNLGMAYYDTKVGIRHPSLKYDLMGRIAEACKHKGIAFSAYINVGLSHEEALRHREWTVVSPEGYTYLPDRLDHFFRRMCYNSPYAEHLLEMVREVVSGYPIAGMFLDCMLDAPCVGVECIRQMKQRGVDWNDPAARAEFAHESTISMSRRIADTATAIKKDLLLYFNGIALEDQQDIGTYVEYECLPTGGWGYESLPLYARYARNLGKPLLNQTARFHKSWGDFGGIRTAASLEYDCLYGLANGMRTTIGSHLHPRGDLNHAVFDLVERVYTGLQKLEPWLDGAVPETDIAVVAPDAGFRDVYADDQVQGQGELRGAARMLCELNMQFDILPNSMPCRGYPLLVLPDRVTLDQQAVENVRAHLDAGGTILSTGWSGLDPDRGDFVFSEWGVKFHGGDSHDPAYFAVEPALNAGVPDMPHNFYGQGTATEALEGTEVLARIVAPYHNRHWDGEHGYLYLPPDKVTDQAAVTLRGPVAHISHPVFGSYFQDASIPLRQIVANLLSRLLPEPLVVIDGFPSFARATVTRQPDRRMVHLLAYVPERRGKTIDMIEEPIELRDVPLALRADGRKPQRVYLAPQQEELQFRIGDGYIHTTIPVLAGHALVVFEQ